MEIYDISQELTKCAVYTGDKTPEAERVTGSLADYSYKV